MERAAVVLEVGLNEAASRAQNPYVPYASRDCAEDGLRCRAAGAAVVHWHARDAATGAQREGDAALYAAALDQMRAASDVVAYPTYPIQPPHDLDARLGHCWKLRESHGLEIAPIDVGSVNVVTWNGERRSFGPESEVLGDLTVVQNSLGFTVAALARFDALGLIPSVAAFDIGFTRTMVHLVRAGKLHQPVFFKIFLLGAWLAGPTPSEQALEFHLREIPPDIDVEWLVVPYAIRDPALIERLSRRALELGGGIRIGIGDNPEAFPEATNPQLVERAVRWCTEVGRTIASPADVRNRLGVTPFTRSERV
ncbi:MAG TPA: 3-keto-5-aminohexanoate cleavage protein [Candidatus Binatia bacterium]|nr:3-keto-5-aminohexanoate cleavage protein [Candidatus Binatia bacterium]